MRLSTAGGIESVAGSSSDTSIMGSKSATLYGNGERLRPRLPLDRLAMSGATVGATRPAPPSPPLLLGAQDGLGGCVLNEGIGARGILMSLYYVIERADSKAEAASAGNRLEPKMAVLLLLARWQESDSSIASWPRS